MRSTDPQGARRRRRRHRAIVAVATIASMALAVAAPVAAATPGQQRWVARDAFADAYGDWSDAVVALSPDGTRVFVASQFERYLDGRWVYHHIAVMAYRAGDGARRWISFYDGPRGAGFADDGGFGGPHDIAVTPDGATVVVTGFSDSHAWETGQTPTPASDYVTIALDATTSDRRWVARYDGTAHGEDTAEALAIADGGRTVVVTGRSLDRGSGPDVVTIAYRAADGVRRWIRRTGLEGRDQAFDVAITPEGRRAVVVGASQPRRRDRDVLVLAYRLTGGGLDWSDAYAGSAGGKDQAVAVTAGTEPASVYVTGYARTDDGAKDVVTLAYDVDGRRRWLRLFDGPTRPRRGDIGVAVAPVPGGVAVAATTRGEGTVRFDTDALVLTYRADDGAPGWTARVIGDPGSRDRAVDLAASPDLSHLYLASGVAEAADRDQLDYLTVSLDPLVGLTRWSARFAGAYTDAARSLAVDPEGSFVVVTGGSHTLVDGTLLSEATTVAYEA